VTDRQSTSCVLHVQEDDGDGFTRRGLCLNSAVIQDKYTAKQKPKLIVLVG